MLGLLDLRHRYLFALWHAKAPMQCAGMFNRAGHPVAAHDFQSLIKKQQTIIIAQTPTNASAMICSGSTLHRRAQRTDAQTFGDMLNHVGKIAIADHPADKRRRHHKSGHQISAIAFGETASENVTKIFHFRLSS